MTDPAQSDSGLADSGAPDGGSTDGGFLDSGLTDSGAPDSGSLDSGLADSGAPDASTTRTHNVHEWRSKTWALLMEASAEARDLSGNPTGGPPEPVVEGSLFEIFPSCGDSSGWLPENTKDWLQGEPCSTIVFDPHALYEVASASGTSWSDAGLLVRGVLVQGDTIEVDRALTLADFNLVDASATGKLQDGVDHALPDDSTLEANWQAAIAELKRVLLESL